MSYKRRGTEVRTKGKGARLCGKLPLFVDEYMIDRNGVQAAKRAGYKSNNLATLAAQIMTHPLVIEEISRRDAENREKNELTAEYVIQKLVAIVERTEKESPSAALRGLELLGKTLALFKERQEISGVDGNAIEYEQKVKENVADFTSRIASLAERSREGEVTKFPEPGRDRRA